MTLTSMMLADTSIREQALDITRSFIVQAPAGSGKTELLTQRFLSLLAHTETPEAILAITFTRKAAQEMRERVLSKLRLAESDYQANSAHEIKTLTLAKQVLKQDKLLSWQLLKNPNRLQIQTIDSLCAKLARALPLSSQTACVTDVTDNAEQLYQQTVNALIENTHDTTITALLSKLLDHCDNDINVVSRLLCQLLATRDQWLSHIIHGADHLLEEFNQTLQQINIKKIETLNTLLPNELKKMANTIIDYACQNKPGLQDEFFKNESNPSLQQKNYFLGLRFLLLNQKGEWRKSLTKAQGFPAKSNFKLKEEKSFAEANKHLAQELQENLQYINGMGEALAALDHLPPLSYDESQWQLLKILFKLLPIACAKLKLHFHQKGLVDFVELSLAALDALGKIDDPSELALILDYKIQHILVDEFQDTSSTQLQLLQKITQGWQMHDGKTLFFVGDPMQSIYRFRNAQVGLFLHVQQNGLNDIQLMPLTLTSNFRSCEGLVNFFNSSFSDVFPKQSDINTSAIHYSPSTAVIKEKTENIACHLCVDETHEANVIADQIKQIQSANPEQSIAILVRARSHLRDIFRALAQQQIDFCAQDIEPLANQPWILDILSLLRALLQPTDRIAWLSLLRAPFCGLNLRSLHLIANYNDETSIYQRLQDENILSQLDSDMRTRVHCLTSHLAVARHYYQRSSMSLCLRQVWQELQAHACYGCHIDDDIEQFFLLLNKIENEHVLINITTVYKQLASLFSKPKQKTSVQIMTMHKAKGLEFDTVIIPAAHKRTLKTDNALFLWTELMLDQRIELLLAPIHARYNDDDPIYRYIQYLEKEKDELENRRLLYVAATRAKQQLIMTGIAQKDNRFTKHSFLDYLWPHLAQMAQLEEAYNISHDTQAHTLHRIPLNTMNASAISLAAGEAFTLTFEQQIESTIGTLVHEALQRIADDGLELWDEERLQKQVPYFVKQLLSHSLDESYLESILQPLHKTLQDKTGRWILGSHAQAQSELSINVMEQGSLNKVVIDRTFVDDSGIRWIIDYKTVSKGQLDLSDFCDIQKNHYQHQLRRYRKALSSLYSEDIKTALYFPNESLLLEC